MFLVCLVVFVFAPPPHLNKHACSIFMSKWKIRLKDTSIRKIAKEPWQQIALNAPSCTLLQEYRNRIEDPTLTMLRWVFLGSGPLQDRSTSCLQDFRKARLRKDFLGSGPLPRQFDRANFPDLVHFKTRHTTTLLIWSTSRQGTRQFS